MGESNNTPELNNIIKTLAQNQINLDIRNIKKLGEGWMSHAYLFNDRLVFRFPKEQQGAKDLEKEIQALPFLKKQISLPIPEFKYFGTQENGFPFVGYTILPGELLNKDLFQGLSFAVKSKLAKQIANFITEIRTVPYRKAISLKIPVNNFYDDYANTYEDIQETVFSLINMDARYYISSQFNLYLGNENNFQYQPTLIHADLSLNHLLFDREVGELSGIIDFGDIEIGDTDYEYLYLLEECGEDFTRQVMKLVGEKEISRKLEKISFFLLVDNIGVIGEGLRINNDKMIEEEIAEIEQEVKKRTLQYPS